MQPSSQGKYVRYFILALALFVFLFALHAKISLYQPAGHGGEVSKLWLKGQKMDVLNSIESAATALVALLTVVLFLLSPPFLRLDFWGWICLEPAYLPTSSFEFSRFVRPPPVL
jgi:hypothetical protein